MHRQHEGISPPKKNKNNDIWLVKYDVLRIHISYIYTCCSSSGMYIFQKGHLHNFFHGIYRCEDVILRSPFSLGFPRVSSWLHSWHPKKRTVFLRSWCFKRYADLGVVLVASSASNNLTKGNGFGGWVEIQIQITHKKTTAVAGR